VTQVAGQRVTRKLRLAATATSCRCPLCDVCRLSRAECRHGPGVGALHRSSTARFVTGCRGRPGALGSGRGAPAGVRCGNPAGTFLVHGAVVCRGGHRRRADCFRGWILFVHPAAGAVSTLGGGDSDRTWDCPARHVNWRSLNPARQFGLAIVPRHTDELVGVPYRSDGRRGNSSTAASSSSETPSSAHAPTLRNSCRRSSTGRSEETDCTAHLARIGYESICDERKFRCERRGLSLWPVWRLF
jgi:hypothetical protein